MTRLFKISALKKFRVNDNKIISDKSSLLQPILLYLENLLARLLERLISIIVGFEKNKIDNRSSNKVTKNLLKL